MAINEGFEDGLDPAEELQKLVEEQAADQSSSCGAREDESLFDPRILNRWSEKGKIQDTGSPGLWLYKI